MTAPHNTTLLPGKTYLIKYNDGKTYVVKVQSMSSDGLAAGLVGGEHRRFKLSSIQSAELVQDGDKPE